MTEETARLVAAMREVLEDRPDVHLALLFGSQARGTARPDSDLDVAIQGENLDVFDLYGDLSLATRREVDVVDLSHAGFALLNAIARDHVVIHQGRPGRRDAGSRTRSPSWRRTGLGTNGCGTLI